MGMQLVQVMDQRLDQRQELELRLEQRLEQQQRQEIRLGQYLNQEDMIKGMIRYADNHETWKKFDKDGFNFVYATLPHKIARPIADKYGPGFSHCLYDPFEALFFGQKTALAQGDWTLFVVPEMMPDESEDIVALHERGEELSLGNHYFASQLEFAYAQKIHKLRKHTTFTDKAHPHKFVDLTEEVLYPVLPEELREIVEARNYTNNGERERAESLIGKHPLPISVLKKMAEYGDVIDDTYESINGSVGPAQASIEELYQTENPELVAREINVHLQEAISSIHPKYLKLISKSRANSGLDFFNEAVDQSFFRSLDLHLNFPKDISAAYDLYRSGKPLVTVAYRVGDKRRPDNSQV